MKGAVLAVLLGAACGQAVAGEPDVYWTPERDAAIYVRAMRPTLFVRGWLSDGLGPWVLAPGWTEGQSPASGTIFTSRDFNDIAQRLGCKRVRATPGDGLAGLNRDLWYCLRKTGQR